MATASRPILVTKILKPTAPRITRLSENMVLPRSVPLGGFLAGAAGGILGLLIGLGIGSLMGAAMYGAVLAGLAGAMGGIGLTYWKPLPGESVSRVALVKLSARRGAKWSMCPGSGGAALFDPDLGSDVCNQCLAAVSSEDGLAEMHMWKRQVFLGMMPIGAPSNDAVTMKLGSVRLTRV